MSNRTPSAAAEKEQMTIRPVGPSDRSAVSEVLKSVGLPYNDIDFDKTDIFVAVDGGEIVGTVGLQVEGHHGLLRSLAVRPDYREHGTGRRLCDAVLEHAIRIGIREVYLLTTDAAGYFEKRGFSRIERTSVPERVRQMSQFQLSSCSSATTMMRAM